MIIYTIRHKPTGEFMPSRMYRSSVGGWSYWIPGTEDKPHDPNPRVFYSLVSARNALTAWLQGEWHREQGQTSGSYFDPPENYSLTTISEPAAPRVRDDMEILVWSCFMGQAVK